MITPWAAATAHASGSFHVNLGDVPTWLGVVAASVAAYFVYGQLRSQQDEFKRQVRALERQQADHIHIEVAQIWGDPTDSEPPKYLGWLVLTNRSQRPIRDATARICLRPGSEWLRPSEVRRYHDQDAIIEPETWEAYDSQWNPKGVVAQTVLPGERFAFFFQNADNLLGLQLQFDIHRQARTHFTDDAGLPWEIDENWHLQKLGKRDW